MRVLILTFLMIVAQFGMGYTACQGFMSIQEENTTVLMHEKSSSDHQMDHCTSRCDWVRHEIFRPLFEDAQKTLVRLVQVVLRLNILPLEDPALRLVLGPEPIPRPDGLGIEPYLLNSSFLI
jgi:hypothetical protein